MDRTTLETILNEYAINKNKGENYYISLALRFASLYISAFPEKKILDILDFNHSIKFSRLNIESLLDLDDANDLSFEDNYIFYLDNKPSFEMDAKRNVINTWHDGKKVTSNSPINVLNYVSSLEEREREILIVKLQEYQEHSIFLSYFYQYVLSILEESVSTNIDSARVGLFKNAYFNILNYTPLDLDILKR